MTDVYDYIICGAGAAGLSLAYHLSDAQFNHLKILILDKEVKSGNDHTWCFWDKEDSPFDHITTRQFPNVNFFSSTFKGHLNIAPYKYKMIQSTPFYEMILERISESDHIQFKTEEVESIEEDNSGVSVKTKNGSYRGKEAFSSIFNGKIDQQKQLYVAQHFRGWFIKTKEAYFDPDTATFMDFRIDQAGDCRFFYVLPISEHEALVEIAIFSNEIMQPEGYDPLISDYITTYLDDIDFHIEEKEYGVIPMTDYPFWKHNSDRIFHIGTAGGAVKPSSGYAFKRIQDHTELIIEAISNRAPIKDTYSIFKNRFYLYDKVLLDVILKQKKSGASMFTYMFKNNSTPAIFKFLDGKTTLLEETKLFTTLPSFPFTRAWLRQKLGL